MVNGHVGRTAPSGLVSIITHSPGARPSPAGRADQVLLVRRSSPAPRRSAGRIIVSLDPSARNATRMSDLTGAPDTRRLPCALQLPIRTPRQSTSPVIATGAGGTGEGAGRAGGAGGAGGEKTGGALVLLSGWAGAAVARIASIATLGLASIAAVGFICLFSLIDPVDPFPSSTLSSSERPGPGDHAAPPAATRIASRSDSVRSSRPSASSSISAMRAPSGTTAT